MENKKQIDTSTLSDEALKTINEMYKRAGQPKLKKYRAWQYVLIYILATLFFGYVAAVSLYLTEGEDADVVGGTAAFSFLLYLYLYLDKRKNIFIALSVFAVLGVFLGIAMVSLFFGLIQALIYVLTLVALLVKWNGKRSEWSQLWFEI